MRRLLFFLALAATVVLLDLPAAAQGLASGPPEHIEWWLVALNIGVVFNAGILWQQLRDARARLKEVETWRQTLPTDGHPRDECRATFLTQQVWQERMGERDQRLQEIREEITGLRLSIESRWPPPRDQDRRSDR